MSVQVSEKLRVMTQHVRPDYQLRLNDLVQAFANGTISETEMSEIRSKTSRQRLSFLALITDVLFPSLRA